MAGTFEYWSPRDEELLRQLNGKVSMRDLMSRLGRSRVAIKHKLKKMREDEQHQQTSVR